MGEATGSDTRRRDGDTQEARWHQATVPAAALPGLPVPDGAGAVPRSGPSAHRVAASVKAWVRDRFGQLAAALAGDGRTARPGLLADQLWPVMEGTYASAQALSADGPARHPRALAESLLDVS